MAVLQRTSLLDQVAQCRTLELALVIDATESMSDQLDGVRDAMAKMMEDLDRAMGNRFSVQIVLYRDQGAGDLQIEFPSRKTSGHLLMMPNASRQAWLDWYRNRALPIFWSRSMSDCTKP